jgi:hypothetical protein
VLCQGFKLDFFCRVAVKPGCAIRSFLWTASSALICAGCSNSRNAQSTDSNSKAVAQANGSQGASARQATMGKWRASRLLAINKPETLNDAETYFLNARRGRKAGWPVEHFQIADR